MMTGSGMSQIAEIAEQARSVEYRIPML